MVLEFQGNKREVVYSAVLNNMAFANLNGVLSGCLVKASSSTMKVDVESGRIFFGNDNIDVSASTGTLSIDVESSSNTRKDLILVNNTGTLSVLKGTASAIPATPDYNPEDYIVLAIITIDNTTTNITSTEIKDIRVLNQGGSGGSGGTFGRYVEEFTAQTTVVVQHNLGDDEPNVFVYDSSGVMIEESVITSITADNINQVTVVFSSSTTGKIIVYGGLGINNAYYSEEYSSSATWVVTHNMNNKYVNVVCYDSSDKIIEESSITSITATDENTITIVFGSATAGRVVITGGTAKNEGYGSSSNDLPIQENDSINASDINKAYYQGAFCSTLNYGNINITTTATLIKAANTLRQSILIYNNGIEAIYIGQNAVTTSSGFELEAEESILLYNKEEIYAISSSTTNDIRYLEVQ